MKKLFLSILAAAGITFAAAAQDITFGAKGGLNIAKLTKFDDASTRASIYAGGFVNLAFNEWAIQPELLFSGQGTRYDVPLVADRVLRMNYLNIPVMVQYHLIPEFYLEAGPQLGFLLSAKDKGGKVTVNVKENFKGADFGLGFGLGYKFPVGVGISARYMFGLANVSDAGNNNHKNSVAQIGAFYVFNTKLSGKR